MLLLRRRGTPAEVSGETTVASTAGCEPPHNGRPLAITSMRRSSCLCARRFRSASRLGYCCTAVPALGHGMHSAHPPTPTHSSMQPAMMPPEQCLDTIPFDDDAERASSYMCAAGPSAYSAWRSRCAKRCRHAPAAFWASWAVPFLFYGNGTAPLSRALRTVAQLPQRCRVAGLTHAPPKACWLGRPHR